MRRQPKGRIGRVVAGRESSDRRLIAGVEFSAALYYPAIVELYKLENEEHENEKDDGGPSIRR